MKKKNKLLLICASSIVILNCYNSTVDAKNKSSAVENSNKITYIYVGKEIPKNVQTYHKSKEWLEYEKEQKLKNQNKENKNINNKNKNKNKDEQNNNINQENKQVKKYDNIKQNKKKFKTAKYNQTLSNNIQNQQYNTNNHVLLNDFIYNGIIYYQNYKFTYASQKVAPGKGLNIPGRHVQNGFVVDKDNYIVLGAHPDLRYNIYDTPFGQKGKVYDAGPINKSHLNVYLE